MNKLSAACIVAVGVAQKPYADPNLANSVLLTDYVESFGSRCLDGTPQRYWIAPATSTVNSTKWYIHFMGGGWCESTVDCAARAYQPSCYIGSSNPQCFNNSVEPGNSVPGVIYNETMDYRNIPSILGSRWGGGLLNNNPVTNPLSYDWNRVEISYCTGDSYASSLNDPVNTTYGGQDVQLWYRGRLNLNAIIDSLVTTQGLDKGTEMIVSGDSAGGLATYWHSDYISSVLNEQYGAHVRVTAAPDSGFFYSDASYPAWNSALRWVVTNGNATGGLNQACVAHMTATGGDPISCAFPEVASGYLLTPQFVMNSRFDPALDSISGGENGSNATNVNRLGARLLDLVNASAMALPGNAAFITSCHQHCGQWAQGQTVPYGDFNVTIIRTEASGQDVAWQAVPALQSWYGSLSSPSAWQHANKATAKTSAVAVQAKPTRTVHDDLVWLKAVALLERLTRDGVPAAKARALALPRWVAARAPPAHVTYEQVSQAYSSTAAPNWWWIQPALYPCANCCNGGQS